MIQKNEIRVGNWVSKDGEEYQATTNTAEIIERGAELQPIPLTLDWLSKFGFYIVNHIHGYTFFAHKKYKIDVYKEKTTWMGYSIKKCDFVHQLQNAIYILNGEDVA